MFPYLGLNPIERVWAQFKRYTKGHCTYTLPSMRKNVPIAYDTVTLDNIKAFYVWVFGGP